MSQVNQLTQISRLHCKVKVDLDPAQIEEGELKI